jgi:predicted transposase YbfD/YdcC
VENNLHWRLDISFREDDSRLRERNAADNGAILRHIGFGHRRNRERHDHQAVKAVWDESYLAKLSFARPLQ